MHSIRHVNYKIDGKIRSDTAVVYDNNTINDTNNKKERKGMKEKQIRNEHDLYNTSYNTSFCYE